MKVTEFPSITTLDGAQVFLVDGASGTKKILASDLLFALEHLNSPQITHRNTFRGKSLGTAVTSDQWSEIVNGTFGDLWLGDYWTINNIVWRIADFDYWMHCGDTEFTQHHLVIVPDHNLYNAKMNDTNVTTGGYTGSAMYTSNLASAKTTINSAFGSSHVLTHKEYLVNAVTNGKPSGAAWVESKVELMTEAMVYGHLHFSPTSDGSTVPSIHSIDKLQLALFQQAPEFVNTRETYWLRDVVSAAYFASVRADGLAAGDGASGSRGVRPAFAIG